MGYVIAQRGLRFRILDAGAEIGHVWRSRWDSLSLFTPAQYDDLPGLDFDAPRDTYPGKDDVADYLRAYAAKFTGKYMHRAISGGVGHNLPQEAPEPFVQAVMEVHGFSS